MKKALALTLLLLVSGSTCFAVPKSKEAERLDAEQDAALGSRRGDELPDDLRRREQRLVKIREARARLEAEARAAAEAEGRRGRPARADLRPVRQRRELDGGIRQAVGTARRCCDAGAPSTGAAHPALTTQEGECSRCVPRA